MKNFFSKLKEKFLSLATWKKILSVALAVVILGGAVTGIAVGASKCSSPSDNNSSLSQSSNGDVSESLSTSEEESSSTEDITEPTYIRVNKDKTPDENGEYILFGSYPQTKVNEEETDLLNALNTQAGTLPIDGNNQDWISYKYYSGNGNIGSQNNDTDYMWYQDETYGGEKYRGVYFTSYRPFWTDENGTALYSEQDQHGYVTNGIYWFLYEPIQWRILSEENDEALILCELLIDSQEYNYTDQSREIKGQTVYANNYAESSIRAWLNDNFYNTAFGDLQKAIIQQTTVDNSVRTTNNPDYNPHVCENTVDNVFLLSYQDLINTEYGFDSNDSTDDETRQKKPTDYARCQGVYTFKGDNYTNNGYWWLRSPYSSYDNTSSRVEHDGYSNRPFGVHRTTGGICPALYIQL